MNKDETMNELITKLLKWLDAATEKALLDIKWTQKLLSDDDGQEVSLDDDQKWSDEFLGEWE